MQFAAQPSPPLARHSPLEHCSGPLQYVPWSGPPTHTPPSSHSSSPSRDALPHPGTAHAWRAAVAVDQVAVVALLGRGDDAVAADRAGGGAAVGRRSVLPSSHSSGGVDDAVAADACTGVVQPSPGRALPSSHSSPPGRRRRRRSRSSRQSLRQPSPSLVLPSSHSSPPRLTTPSPQRRRLCSSVAAVAVDRVAVVALLGGRVAEAVAADVEPAVVAAGVVVARVAVVALLAAGRPTMPSPQRTPCGQCGAAAVVATFVLPSSHCSWPGCGSRRRRR